MLNVKKIASVAMAAMMAVTVSATTLTASSAEAASHGPQVKNEQHYNRAPQMVNHKSTSHKMDNHRIDHKAPRMEHKSAPHHSYNDRDDSGNMIAAGILGIAVGAILANS